MVKKIEKLDKVIVDRVDDFTTYLLVSYHTGWFIGQTIGNDNLVIDKDEYRERKINQII